MMSLNSSSSRKRATRIELMSPKSIADEASWYCALVLVALVLLITLFTDTSSSNYYYYHQHDNNKIQQENVLLTSIRRRPCEEIYVVGEGETLHTISDKCGDPFIVENNPHIHDPDDVFPGLVIKIITPS